MSPAWLSALGPLPLPAALVDLDAFDRNLRTLAAAADDRAVRLATKSVRCPALLQRAAEALGDQLAGFMAVSPREAAHPALAPLEDVLVAYPVARIADARPLVELAAAGRSVHTVVDDAYQVALLDELGRQHGVQLGVVIDVDASWRPSPGVHLGVRRSPLRSPARVVALANRVRDAAGVRLDGIMVYEAQIAGIPDRSGDWRDPAKRWIKQRSQRHVRELRAEVVQALVAAGHAVGIVNGGGTGSVRFTASDPAVTEVTIGSGLLSPHLFDGYDGIELQPAAFAALPVARRSDPDHVTVHGGGYPASGASGADRAPRVHHPPGLSPLGLEGFGEVQTPLREARPGSTVLGDVVLVRHAKAGELLERFSHVHLVSGDTIVQTVPTYRGLGLDLG